VRAQSPGRDKTARGLLGSGGFQMVRRRSSRLSLDKGFSSGQVGCRGWSKAIVRACPAHTTGPSVPGPSLLGCELSAGLAQLAGMLLSRYLA